MSSIKKRILEYIDYKNITEYEFCRKSGFTQGVLKRKTGISEENITKFVKFFPEVDVNWLITGEKKALVQSKVRSQKKPDFTGAKRDPAVDYVSEFETIHNKMHSLEKTIRRLKKDVKSLSKQVNQPKHNSQH